MLAIEIGGESHNTKKVYDDKRENELKRIGIHFLRFDGHSVLKNPMGVLQVLTDWIDEFERNPPLTPPKRGI